MTETQHPSEMEATMDNLEILLEAVGVARQKVRDRRRRSVPKRAPRRPEADPIDWVDDAEEGQEEELETESEQTPEHEADSVDEPADEEQSVEGEVLRPGAGSAPLPSGEHRGSALGHRLPDRTSVDPPGALRDRNRRVHSA